MIDRQDKIGNDIDKNKNDIKIANNCPIIAIHLILIKLDKRMLFEIS